MLRVARRGATPAVSTFGAAKLRFVATRHDEVALPTAPQPPMIPEDPTTPMDFSPHIEWYEYPREVWDPKYPYTREECIRMHDERWDSTADEMAQKYGMRLIPTPKLPFWMAWFTMLLYIWFNLWSCYRSSPDHPSWPQWRVAIQEADDCPTIHEDEVYLDTWIAPQHRQRWYKADLFWAWKPVVKKDGATNPWAIELERKDPSEWKHMVGK